MLQIAIIGAGKLGSRHLQGLASIRHLSQIHLVDPSAESLASAKARLNELAGNQNIDSVREHSEVPTIPKSLDLVVLATTSDVRLAVIRELLQHADVRFLLLEKVLFPRLAEYNKAAELFRLANVRAWVNCSRRLFDVYIDAREEFLEDKLIHMDVTGGNWGLGCNSVHFLDLMAYMTGEIPDRFNISGLMPGVFPAKRSGFVEFSGTISATTSAATINLTAHESSSARQLVTLRGECLSYVVDEVAGRYWKMVRGGTWIAGEFHTPLQSQMTGNVANMLFSDGDCGLPQFEESSRVHQPFLAALIRHLNSGQPHGSTTCPIT